MNDVLQGYASEDNVRRSLSENSYNTPRMPSSRRSSGRATPASPTAPSTPPLYSAGHDESKQTNRMSMNLSNLDPHSFTPSLHASLVSEILSLRREVESKGLSIETLESNLQGAKVENDALQEKVTRNARESRAVKKQLTSIEDGTLSAIEGLCKERDEAHQAKLVLQRRLEESQTKVKALDAETKRLTTTLANEKRHWENEKVSLVRRMTVAESRLTAFVKEFAGAQAGPASEVQDLPPTRSVTTPTNNNNVKSDESDGRGSVRTLSKRGHGRGNSSIATTGGLKRSNTLPKGASLADEINFEEEYDEASDEDESESDLHRRTLSRSTTSSEARRVLGMVTQIESRASQIRGSLDSPRGLERSGSRKRSPVSLAAAEDAQLAADDVALADSDLAASPEAPDSPAVRLRSDPATALHERSSEGATATSTILRKYTASTPVTSAATQTDPEAPPPPPTRPPPMIPVAAAPSITIHTPDGKIRPKSPELPVDSRNVGCQTESAPWSTPSRSTGVQTEGIRIDNRASKLPAHLLPSALDDIASVSPVSSYQSERGSRSITDTPATSYEDVKAELDLKDDEENIEEGSWARLKRALRPSGSSRPSVDVQDSRDLSDVNVSEDELSMPSIPKASGRNLRSSRPSFQPPTPVPEDEKVGPGPVMASQPFRQTNFATVLQQGRPQSPNVGSGASSSNVSRVSGPRPPFAVPPRRSSKTRGRRAWKKTVNISPTRAGRLSPRSRSQFGQDPILRKVQSAIALNPDEALGYRDARSAQSESPYSPLSPVHPPVPVNSAAYRHYRGRSSRSQPFLQSYNLASPTANASVTNSVQYSVVDAITATMIGEWMWKYQRKRKSFGVTEATESGKTAVTRHRRWVWLSPYERTIMWSSKQPTSNSALMGKPGRKLSIQSVLDVKDDSPVPKGADPEMAFGHSILILTPSRALKFTAPTRERHYLWLNALSFLAHQSNTSDSDNDLHFPLETMPPAPSPAESKLPSARDSIRGPLASMRTSIGRQSSRSSGQATPTLARRESFVRQHQHQRQDSDIPDAAFAPTVPRVPIHSRKRSVTNPTRSRPTLGGLSLPSPTALGFSSNASMLSAASSSLRGTHSYSGASSMGQEHSHAEVDETVDWTTLPNNGHVARGSKESAEFGGNTNFFDAGGLFRMQAFVSPGVLVGTSRPKQQSYGPTPSQPMHGNGEGSKDSFIGPPPIGRQGPKPRRFFGRRTVVGERNTGGFSADEA